ALDAGAKAHAADGEGGAGSAALLGNHYAFKSLQALFFLFAFAFLQAHVHANGVAWAEFGEVVAQLRFMQFTDCRIHVRSSLQTHSGGASTSETNCNYRTKWALQSTANRRWL